MGVHRKVNSPGIYFITFTCHNWLPLIEWVKGYDLVYKWFDILSEQGNAITGYVIMPNHIHLLLYFSGGKSLNTIIGNGKRFMAYDIVKRLIKQKEKALLWKLRCGVKYKDKMRGKLNEVWKNSFDVRECRTDAFVFQKLRYIHNNPCTGKWKLAGSIVDYPHSSASFYIRNKPHNYIVRDYREFLNFEE